MVNKQAGKRNEQPDVTFNRALFLSLSILYHISFLIHTYIHTYLMTNAATEQLCLSLHTGVGASAWHGTRVPASRGPPSSSSSFFLPYLESVASSWVRFQGHYWAGLDWAGQMSIILY